MEQYVYNSSYWDTFVYSFFVMLLECTVVSKTKGQNFKT